MKPSGCRSPFAVLFFLTVLLGGLLFAVQGVVGAVSNIEARHKWKTVEATIVDSRLEGEGTSDAPLPIPAVVYTYSFEVKEYRSTSINPPDNPVSHATPFLTLAEVWLAQHPKGMRTKALVDPKNPQKSALETNLNYRHTTWLFLPVPFLMFGIAGLVGQRPFPWRTVIFLWGFLAIALHIAAGPVTMFAWICIAMTIFVMVRVVWSNFGHTRPRR